MPRICLPEDWVILNFNHTQCLLASRVFIDNSLYKVYSSLWWWLESCDTYIFSDSKSGYHWKEGNSYQVLDFSSRSAHNINQCLGLRLEQQFSLLYSCSICNFFLIIVVSKLVWRFWILAREEVSAQWFSTLVWNLIFLRAVTSIRSNGTPDMKVLFLYVYVSKYHTLIPDPQHIEG